MSAAKKKGKFILIGLAVIGIAGCVGLNVMAKNMMIPVSRSSAASFQTIESFVSTTGTVSKGSQVQYITKTSTFVDQVNFKVGDTVKPGDVIATFDNKSAEDNYRLAQIGYESALLSIEDNESRYFKNKEKLDEATAEMNRAKRQREDYDETDIEYKEYDATYRAKKAEKESLEMQIPSDQALKMEQLGLEKAAIALQTATEDYNNLPKDIIAEGEGIIDLISITEFGMVNKGMVAVQVTYSTTNTIDFGIGKYDLAKIKVGQPVTVTIGRNNYTGTVSEIGTNAVNGLVPSKITVDNADELFVGGLEAELDILTFKQDNVLCIAIESVKTDRNGDYCYVLTPAEKKDTYTATKTYIKTGESSDTHIEVKEGIKEGDLILDNPSSNIDAVPVVKIIG